MQNQSTDNAGSASVKDETSTIDDIKALAPLTEEWLRAKSRQFTAGKHLILAEWALLKRSLLVVILFVLLFTSFVTVLLITINVTIAYALVQVDIHWLLIAAIILLLNCFFTVLCWNTVKRVGANISLSMTKQVLTGKVENTEDAEHE